jgi:CheY-like chemotaxis protein
MNTPCKIMLVDDDKDDQMIFLSAVGEISALIDCNCFDDAEQGLRVLQTNNESQPDCIFLDLNLPLMHGFEFLKSLKNSSNTNINNIPVIIYSTSSRHTDKVKAQELGAFNFFSKPTSYSELKKGITDILKGIHCK